MELAALGTLAKVASIGGTIMSTLGAIQQGQEQKARFQYEQKVAEQQGREAEAASQRDAMARHREGRFLLSQQRAGIAATGSIGDDSVIDLMGDTQDQIVLAGDTEIYKGQQQKRGYQDAAAVAGFNAKNAMKAAYLNAGATLFDGVSTMYSRFGQQAKKTAPTSSVQIPYG